MQKIYKTLIPLAKSTSDKRAASSYVQPVSRWDCTWDSIWIPPRWGRGLCRIKQWAPLAGRGVDQFLFCHITSTWSWHLPFQFSLWSLSSGLKCILCFQAELCGHLILDILFSNSKVFRVIKSCCTFPAAFTRRLSFRVWPGAFPTYRKAVNFYTLFQNKAERDFIHYLFGIKQKQK